MSVYVHLAGSCKRLSYILVYVGEESQVYEELPKLPLPPLQATLDQYLDNLRSVRH
jgi:hypothetical protein